MKLKFKVGQKVYIEGQLVTLERKLERRLDDVGHGWEVSPRVDNLRFWSEDVMTPAEIGAPTKLVLCSDWEVAVRELNKKLKPAGLKIRTKTNYKEWGDQIQYRIERILP